MSDTWVRAGRAAVIVVGVIVAAISYSHIRDWALAHGGDWLTAPLLPLGIDGAVVAMTLFMHQAQGLAQWLSRFGLLVSIGATVAFNTAYGAVFGVAAALGWSIPPVLLVICIEVSVLTVRKARPAAVPVVAEPVKPEPVSEPSEVSEPAVTVAAPPLAAMTRQEQAKALNLKVRTLYRKIERGELPELANGKAHG